MLHELAKASVSVGLPSPQVEDSMFEAVVCVPGSVMETGDSRFVVGVATP